MKGRGFFAGALLLSTLAGCSFYHAVPLDEAKLLEELRSAEVPADTVGKTELSDGLSPDGAVALALRFNPELNAFRQERGIAAGEVSSASALANPEVGVEWLHLQEYYTRVMGWDVDLGWAPPQPFEWAAKRGRALADLNRVQNEIAEREISLASAVRVSHAELTRVTGEIELSEKSLAARRKIAEFVSKRVARGAGTRFERDLSELALARSEAESQRLQAEQVRAAHLLMDLIGARSDAPPRLQAGASPDAGRADRLDAKALEDRALRLRPGLLAAKDRYEMAEQSLRLEHAKKWPWFKFTSIPGYGNNWKNSVTNWDIGGRFTLPIFDWNGGRIDSAFAARDRQRFEFVGTLARVRRDIASGVAEVRAATKTLQVYRDRVLPALEEHERLLQVSFRAGALDVVALLDAEEVAQRSRREYLRSIADAASAWSRLDRSVGVAVSKEAGEGSR